MYDAVSASLIPSGAQAVAGYVDGLYTWSAADWGRFPNAQKLQIAVFATTVADVLDIEQGNDMTPSHWVSWVQLCRANGRNPIAYMNTSTWNQVRNAFISAGVAEPMYWVAQYDNLASIPTGSVGKQYASNNDYDTSVMQTTAFPGDPAPAGGGGQTFQEEDDMPESIKPLSERASGEYAYSFSKGQYREAAFVTDTLGDSNAQLRVVVWATSGLKVYDGQGVFTGKSTVLPFPDPANTYAVTVRREDSGNHPVAVNFS